MHACMHTYIHTYIHAYTHIHTHTYTHIHTYKHIHTYTHIHQRGKKAKHVFQMTCHSSVQMRSRPSQRMNAMKTLVPALWFFRCTPGTPESSSFISFSAQPGCADDPWHPVPKECLAAEDRNGTYARKAGNHFGGLGHRGLPPALVLVQKRWLQLGCH